MVWVNIPDTDVDQDSPVTVALMTALRDNVQGAIQVNSGAPVPYSSWHPYNKVTIGDSNDGVYWDHSVNGNTQTIQSPTFVDGFEYAQVLFDLRSSTGVLSCSIRRDRDNGDFSFISITSGVTIINFNGYIFSYRARDLSRTHCLEYGGVPHDGGNLQYNDNNGTFRVRLVRISADTGGTFVNGRVALYRRAVL